jgi:hypothetical protein
VQYDDRFCARDRLHRTKRTVRVSFHDSKSDRCPDEPFAPFGDRRNVRVRIG